MRGSHAPTFVVLVSLCAVDQKMDANDMDNAPDLSHDVDESDTTTGVCGGSVDRNIL